MQRTRIDWADFSWNPIRGLCPTNCKLPDGREYCYAKRMYKRFKWDEKIRLDLWGTIWRPSRPIIKKGAKIFLCSTFELFHPIVEEEWRNEIFRIIELNPQHTFQILTKMPENIDRDMPDNVWLGATYTGDCDEDRVRYLCDAKARIKFLSYEPMVKWKGFGFLRYWKMPFEEKLDWIILGRLTGYGKKNDPLKWWIEAVVENARGFEIPIFLKNNLKDIWREPLIQEFPNA